MKDSASSLPSPLTELIGRERELDVAKDLFRRVGVRLVTLTGPGGVGKTRLAIQIAGAVSETFAAGVRFVPLASVSDPALVATSIASTLGLRDRGDRSIRDTLIATLRDKEMLLILDNFEQVMDATTLVTDLLEHCPRLRALVTSRTLLRVVGEHALPVPPLALPGPNTASSLEDLAGVAAVQLFTARAQAVVPAFDLSESTASLIADICHLLDGLPLAIELAAARLTHVPLVTLRERLASRLPLLAGGGGRPDRHQTLRNAIAWSYDLLSPLEQTFFRRLAVFSGGITLDAAEAVSRDLDGSSPASTIDLVGTLIDASLLQQEIAPDGTARYWMLETIREFAGERLENSDENTTVHRVHAAHFLAFATRYELAELHPNGDEAISRLEAERANLRSALAWLEEAGESGQFLRLAATLGRFWYGQGYYQEGRGWLERALGHGGAQAAADRAQALVLLGIIEAYLGANRDAETRLTEGLAACREVGDALHAAYALLFLGGLATIQGDRVRGATLLEETLAAAQVVTDQRLAGILTGLALVNLAVADRSQGNRALAAARIEETLRLDRDAGYTAGMILALGDLGDLARDEGDYARALELFREALGLVRGNPGTRMAIDTIAGVATVAAAVGQAERGARLLSASEALRDQIGYRFTTAENLVAVEQAVAATRAVLGEEAFAMAWAAGRNLRAEQAVAEALAPFAIPPIAPGATLTPREAEILPLLAAGLTDREIGTVLYLSHRTVGNHVARIMAKLGAHTRAATIESAQTKGLLPYVQR